MSIDPSLGEAAEPVRLCQAPVDAMFARADVAQLVEQRFRKPQVAGSIPAVGSLIFDCELPIPDRAL